MPLFRKRKREDELPLSDNDVERIAQLWRSEWDTLAFAAWQGYLNSGRGFLLLDFSRDVTTYVSDHSPVIRGTQDAVYDALKKCRAYDPQTEIVVLLNQFVNAESLTCMMLPTPESLLPPRRYMSAKWKWHGCVKRLPLLQPRGAPECGATWCKS